MRSLFAVFLVGIVIWSVVCAGWLRWDSGGIYGEGFGAVHGIDNERSVWIAATGNTNSLTTADWKSYGLPGQEYKKTASILEQHGRQAVFVVTNPLLDGLVPKNVCFARSSLPFRLAVNLDNIGFIAYVSGPQVYIFDRESLANPIRSHTTLEKRVQTGGKITSPVWMIARFGLSGEQFPAGTPSEQLIAATPSPQMCSARHLLTCHYITAELLTGAFGCLALFLIHCVQL